VICKLFFDPDERLEPIAIDQPLTDGEILPIAGGADSDESGRWFRLKAASDSDRLRTAFR
jgi:hypothetical protein